jgi:hypothetical protein
MKGYCTKAEYFLAKADECERTAKSMSGPARQDLLDICKYWHDLAEQAERLGW